MAFPKQTQKRQLAMHITEHIGDMRNYARSLTGAPDQADDLVQDSVVKALRNLDKFEPGTNLGAWLTTIMRNQHIDNARCRQNGPSVVTIDDWAPALSTPANQIHGLSLRDARRRLKRLRRGEASAMRLVVADGRSYGEAAEMLSIAEGTVKSRLSRAREKLAAA